MLLYVLNNLYLGVWAILLIHCLQSKRLYPIFGNGWRTKAFWLFTFVFFNPLLSFLYGLSILYPYYIERLRLQRSRRKTSDVGRNKPLKQTKHEEHCPEPGYARRTGLVVPALVCAYTCVILILFDVPRTSAAMQPFVIMNKNEGYSDARTLMKTGANIGLINAKNKIQTVSSDSATDDMKLSLRNIRIICENDNRFLDFVAIKMLQSFAELPYVDSVSYYSYGHRPKRTSLSPDVLITLDMPQLTEDKFLLSRQMQVKIECVASSVVSEASSDSGDKSSSSPLVPFQIKSEIQHAGTTLCIECPGTEYEQEAKNISRELTNAIRKQFDNLLRKYDEIPELPGAEHGTDI